METENVAAGVTFDEVNTMYLGICSLCLCLQRTGERKKEICVASLSPSFHVPRSLIPYTTFPQNYQIRLLEADKRQLTSQLKEDCDLFLSKISQLSDIVTKFVDAAEAQRGVIEREKLRAVGMRNKVKALEMVRTYPFLSNEQTLP